MNRELAEKVADAVLYEGYMLYPYRPSAIKNRQRWTFGILYPPSYEEVKRETERSAMHVECLIAAPNFDQVRLQIRLRFLQLEARQLWNSEGEPVVSLIVDGHLSESWDEPSPRVVDLDVAGVKHEPGGLTFHFPGRYEVEPVTGRMSVSAGTRTRTQHQLRGSIECSAQSIGEKLAKVVIEVSNESSPEGDTGDRNQALLGSLLSAHLLVSTTGGEFISLLEPPQEFESAAQACNNTGNFPVLIGEPGERDMLLCSPILLYDYPQIAPESGGDFYDASEMDEMLTLRVLTLTDAEKQEMRLANERVRNLLERTEQNAREQLMRTHGTIRNRRPVSGE